MQRRHAPSNKSSSSPPQGDGNGPQHGGSSRSSKCYGGHGGPHAPIHPPTNYKKKGLLDDDYDDVSRRRSSIDIICPTIGRGNHQHRNGEADRTLFWKALTILACTTLLLLASAIAVALSSHRNEGLHPNKNVFPDRDTANQQKDSLGDIMWDWTTNYHPADDSVETDSTASKEIGSESIPAPVDPISTEDHEIPRNLVFVTDSLPGDARIDPKTLENAAIWQDLYKGSETSKGYKVSSCR
jgi:hypothetical protein